jgi:hypothetical protein
MRAPQAAPVPDVASQSPVSNKALIAEASLTGAVTDRTGAVIAGATVSVINPVTGQARKVSTDSQGRYVFENLPPGNYNLKTSSRGFESYAHSGIAIISNQTTVADVALTIGAATQTITIEADSLAVQADSVTPTLIDGDPVNAHSDLFELTTDSGAVWISNDGRHWKRK